MADTTKNIGKIVELTESIIEAVKYLQDNIYSSNQKNICIQLCNDTITCSNNVITMVQEIETELMGNNMIESYTKFRNSLNNLVKDIDITSEIDKHFTVITEHLNNIISDENRCLIPYLDL